MYNRVPREKLWGALREYDVDGRLLLAVKSLYSCSEVCVLVGELNHNCSSLVLDSDKGVCYHHSSSQSTIQWLDRQSWIDTAESRRWSQLVASSSNVYFCGRLGTTSIFSGPNPWKSGRKSRPTLFDFTKRQPVVAEKHIKTFLWTSHQKKVFMILWEKFIGKSAQKLFGQVWGNSGKSPSHPQKFACSDTCAWSRHGVESAEQSELSVHCEVFWVLLGLLSRDLLQR